MTRSREQIVHDFTYHAPDAWTRKLHEGVRERFRDLALDLNETLPEGREKASALAALEESSFWCNAAIARNTQPPKPHPAAENAGDVVERQQMIAELDTALHGKTIARNATPARVWVELMSEVLQLTTAVNRMRAEPARVASPVHYTETLRARVREA